MRGKLTLALVLCLAAVLLAALAAPAGAAVKTAYTSTNYWIGEDTANFVLWASGPHAEHYTGLVYFWQDMASDPRVTGLAIGTFAGNYNYGAGFFSGTGTVQVGTWDGDDFEAASDGATWRISIHGYQPASMDDPITVRYEGKGVSGSVAGLHFMSSAVVPQEDTYIATETGVIW